MCWLASNLLLDVCEISFVGWFLDCLVGCWVCVKFLLLGVCGFVLLGGGGVSRIFGILCCFCCCGTYFYTQALKGGKVFVEEVGLGWC